MKNIVHAYVKEPVILVHYK